MNTLLHIGLLIMAVMAALGIAFLVRKLVRDNRGSDPQLAPRRNVPLWSASRFKAAFCLLFIAACVWLGMPRARGQSTLGVNQVRPRITTLLSNGTALGSQAYLGTNATGTNNVINGFTNGYAVMNTYLPFMQSHCIPLVANIGNSNKFAQSSNITVTAYACYDQTLTNFSQTPIFTWQAPTSAGVASVGNTPAYNSASTNIPSSIWDGATALAFVVSNTTLSNLTMSLIAGVTP